MSQYESPAGQILQGDAQELLLTLSPSSVDLSFWSPPYHVGKAYEKDMDFDAWTGLLRDVIHAHQTILKPGGFMAVNIADILAYPDPTIPRFQADNVRGKKLDISREQILETQARHPTASRRDLAGMLGCSEQTIQRRVEHNNVRGGKTLPSTRVLLTGQMLVRWAADNGFFLYDQRIWHKDPAWKSSHWHANSYRAVDEFEHIYVFARPGIVAYDRDRLSPREWRDWGSRGVWQIPSVRTNERHEAEFPEELAARMIRLLSPEEGLVLDPFVGSGTTATVARYLRRRYIGIERDANYARLAADRADPPQTSLSL